MEDPMSRVRNSLCAALALALGGLSVGACAKSEKADAAQRPTATNSDTGAIHDPVVDRSQAAARVLAAAQTARVAIANHDTEAAKTHVGAAIDALKQIGAVQLVPIYTEVTEESFIGGVQSAKANKPMVAGQNPVAVKAVAGGYTRVLLDTSVARKQLDAARAAIGRGDLTAADASLKTLQQSVVLEQSATRMPLVRARQNLTLASTAAAQSNWQQVQVQLQASARALGDYAKVAPAGDLGDVHVLQQQISSYASTVAKQHDDAASRINGWWVQAANLSERRS
jgi:hypothetical protein